MLATNITVPATGLAADPQVASQLRQRAKEDPEGTLRTVAQQFESLVMDMLLKGMRKTVSEDAFFDSEATRTYQSLMDQELSRKFASSGQLGLADMLVKQLNQLNAPIKKPDSGPLS